MLERQEIDALLISALYGELTPTEETRLAAHFEAHPSDKTALAALTSTREAVRESRILQVQVDPPQSVSALLLQEAARRAPKPVEQEGWFARLARSFMAHPAMAAAAMLVVVIGVATMVKNRKGDQFAESSMPAASTPSGSSANAEPSLTPSMAAQTERKQPDTGVAAGSGSDSYKVDLADGEGGKDNFGITDPKAGAKNDQADLDGKLRRDIGEAAVARNKQMVAGDETVEDSKQKSGEAKKLAKGTQTGPYLELKSADRAPKDLPKEEGAKEPDATPTVGGYDYQDDLAKEQVNTITPGPRSGAGAGGKPGSAAAPVTPATGGVTTGNVATKTAPKQDPKPEPRPVESQVAQGTSTAAQPAPPATTTPRVQTPARNASPPPPPPAKAPTNVRDERTAEKPRVAPPEDKANDPQLAWAREQHTAILARVRGGDCKGAANIAVGLANRDAAYYQQNVATDRSVKECLAYIDNARERDAEQRAERARASQKRANEPSKRAADQPSKPTAKPTATDSSK